jgi:hypothetical protein
MRLSSLLGERRFLLPEVGEREERDKGQGSRDKGQGTMDDGRLKSKIISSEEGSCGKRI